MATRAEIRDRAANDLGMLRLGQSLQAQDNTRILAAYDEVFAMLKKEGYANWTSTGAVPAEFVPYVATLVADNCLSTYGVSNDRYVRIKNAATEALLKIKLLVAHDYSSQDEGVDY